MCSTTVYFIFECFSETYYECVEDVAEWYKRQNAAMRCALPLIYVIDRTAVVDVLKANTRQIRFLVN